MLLKKKKKKYRTSLSEENATIGDKINWDTFSLKGPSYVLPHAYYEPI